MDYGIGDGNLNWKLFNISVYHHPPALMELVFLKHAHGSENVIEETKIFFFIEKWVRAT